MRVLATSFAMWIAVIVYLTIKEGMKSKTPFKDDLVRFAEWCKKISDETLKGEKQDEKKTSESDNNPRSQ